MQKQAIFRLWNTCFVLKKTVKIDVSTYESVQQVGVRKGPEWILSVFKLFDEGLYDFWTVFGPFWPTFDSFCAIFGTIGGYLGPFWDLFGTKQDHFGGDFGVVLDRLWVDRGSLWGHSGIFLASVWHHFGARFGVVLTPFWGLFWAMFGPFLGHLSPF